MAVVDATVAAFAATAASVAFGYEDVGPVKNGRLSMMNLSHNAHFVAAR